MDKQQKQTILDIPKVIAVGIASPVATVLTSRFGIAGTLIGLALSAVILTALAEMLKVYLARAPATVAKVPTTVVKVPGSVRARLSWRNVRSRLRATFARYSSLPPAPARRQSVLIGSVVAAGISFFVGIIIVTALELGVGKSLSCWVWSDCPEEPSTDDDSSSRISTLPSVFGGSSSARSSTLEVRSSDPQAQPALPNSPESPFMSPSAAPSEASGTEVQDSAAPGQKQEQPSPQEEDKQQSLPDYSEEDQQQSPSNTTEEDRSSRSQDSSQNARSSPDFSSVPWTT